MVSVLYLKRLASSLCNKLHKFLKSESTLTIRIFLSWTATAKIRSFNLLAQELFDDSWPTPPASWQPEVLVPNKWVPYSWINVLTFFFFLHTLPSPIHSCKGCLWSQKILCAFLRIIMCSERLYGFCFVILKTFLGFELPQESYPQSWHVILIALP